MLGAVLLTWVAGCGARVRPPVSLPRSLEVREHVIPWENAYPGDVAVDTAGRVWFTERVLQTVGVFDPATGEFRSYEAPVERSGPYGMVAAPDGGIWFAQSRVGGLVRIDPATAAMTAYVIEGARGGPHLLTWRGGEVWFGLRDGRGYGRLDPRTGESRVYTVERDRPYSLAATDAAIWISSFETMRLLEVDPVTGAATIHNLASLPVVPFGGDPAMPDPRERWPGEVRRVATDATGVWFTDFVRARIIRYDPAAQTLTGYPSLERDAGPYGLARSAQGLLWYGERGGNRITVLDPRTGERVRVEVPTPGAHARNIQLDERRGRAWFPLSETGRLGVVEYR